MMQTRSLNAKFKDFQLPDSLPSCDATVAVPVSRGLQQRIFFLNLRTRKGLVVEHPKRPGLRTVEALGFLYQFTSFVRNPRHKFLGRSRALLAKYHNGISAFEALFKLSKPHGITHVGDQRYVVSLWSSSNYYLVDLKNRTMEAHWLPASPTGSKSVGGVVDALAPKPTQEIFSTYQYHDGASGATYFTTRRRDAGKDSPDHFPTTRVRRHDWQSGGVEELWSGRFGQPTHYIALNRDGRLLGLVQFGDVFDEEGRLKPSTILVLDLEAGREHWIDNTGWSPSAHIDWDPVEPDVCYLSCHNGVITPVDDPLKFLREKVYKWKLFGPAAVHKFRITENGPERLAVFAHPELYRLTIHKVFGHRGRRLMVCTGFPNHVFFADAESMELRSRVLLTEPSGRESVLGSLYPSPDGEKVYTVTTGSFQVVDVASSAVDARVPLGRIHDPFNHMVSVPDSDW